MTFFHLWSFSLPPKVRKNNPHDMLNQCWWEENGNLLSFFFLFSLIFFLNQREGLNLADRRWSGVKKSTDQKCRVGRLNPRKKFDKYKHRSLNRAVWPAHRLPLPLSHQKGCDIGFKEYLRSPKLIRKRDGTFANQGTVRYPLSVLMHKVLCGEESDFASIFDFYFSQGYSEGAKDR